MIVKVLSWLVIAVTAVLSYTMLSVQTRTSWVVMIASVIALWAAITLFVKRTFRWSTINYISTPVFLWGSTHTAALFTEAGALQYVFVSVAIVLSGLWLLTLRYTLHDKRWLIFRGNLLSYINSFIIFFSVSSLYAGIIVIDFSLTAALGIVSALSYFLFMHVMLASHLTWRFASLFGIISMLLITEFFLVLMVLPTSFWVKGLIVTISFYLLTGLSRCELTSVISPALIKRYLAWGTVIITIVLVTAPWQ